MEERNNNRKAFRSVLGRAINLAIVLIVGRFNHKGRRLTSRDAKPAARLRRGFLKDGFMTKPKCPRCKGLLQQLEEKLFWCSGCKMRTDGIDDGDIGYRSQERYAERKEEFQIRNRERELARLKKRYGGRK
jgi:hypothetical protein